VKESSHTTIPSTPRTFIPIYAKDVVAAGPHNHRRAGSDIQPIESLPPAVITESEAVSPSNNRR
jgi:hypothetical protein